MDVAVELGGEEGRELPPAEAHDREPRRRRAAALGRERGQGGGEAGDHRGVVPAGEVVRVQGRAGGLRLSWGGGAAFLAAAGAGG